jgi:3-dehydroquinate synthase
MATLEELLVAMSDFEMTRGDCVVAVGGGVVGDLAGFAASVYMRGVDFYNLPTTLLAQVDSSIGGKTAVNLGKVKNSVGSFKQPRAVLVDVDTLATLPQRHLRNGLCEAVKMAATSNEKLFARFEALNEDCIYKNIEEIITEALKIKKSVVEEDECEKGLRKILNFGHTFGHAVESAEGLSGLYHGECVSIGMLALSCGEVKDRLLAVLKKVGLPTEYKGDLNYAFSFLTHDKKCTSGGVSIVTCPGIGKYKIETVSVDELKKIIINSNI